MPGTRAHDRRPRGLAGSDRTPAAAFRWDIASRDGWEDVASVEARGKTATVVFSRPYPDWKALVASGPLPAQALRGEDFDGVWRHGLVRRNLHGVVRNPSSTLFWNAGRWWLG